MVYVGKEEALRGMELTVFDGIKNHLLGYYLPPTDEELRRSFLSLFSTSVFTVDSFSVTLKLPIKRVRKSMEK
jgi:hypothetical protein